MTPSRPRRQTRSHRSLAAACYAVLLALGCAESVTEPILPPADARLVGQFGSEAFVARAEARLKLTPGAADSLIIYAERWNTARRTTDALSLAIEYSGVGTYALGPSQVDLYELVGGDGIVGSYAGSQPTPGELVISTSGADGTLLTGTLRFWLTPSQSSMPSTTPIAFTDGAFSIRLGTPIGAR